MKLIRKSGFVHLYGILKKRYNTFVKTEKPTVSLEATPSVSQQRARVSQQAKPSLFLGKIYIDDIFPGHFFIHQLPVSKTGIITC
jgi:hypothetical protein